MSRAGLWVAGIYVLLAGSVAVWEAGQAPASGWITLPSLRNIGTFVMTLPVSAPLTLIGLEPPLGNPVVSGLVVLATAGVVYRVAAWVAGRFA